MARSGPPPASPPASTLALALIADDLGEEVSRRTAQELVVYHRRPGGQSQFSALLDIERIEGRFTPLLAWMRERLDADAVRRDAGGASQYESTEFCPRLHG